MENASKALIMAGGVLISLMIIGALLLMFNSLSSYQNANVKDQKEAEILTFNNQYTSYARNNVRGNDLYSLLNKVVDYNRRKSSAGTNEKDQGELIGYMPMEITVTVHSNALKEIYMEDAKTYTHLIGSSANSDVTFKASNTSNTFDNIMKDVETLKQKYGENALNKLVIAMTDIFLDDNSANDSEKNDAVEKYNKIVSKQKAKNYNDIKEKSQIRIDIYRYREYVQFKRARFNCTNTEYDNGTGRIIKMTFESNGKFE